MNQASISLVVLFLNMFLFALIIFSIYMKVRMVIELSMDEPRKEKKSVGRKLMMMLKKTSQIHSKRC